MHSWGTYHVFILVKRQKPLGTGVRFRLMVNHVPAELSRGVPVRSEVLRPCSSMTTGVSILHSSIWQPSYSPGQIQEVLIVLVDESVVMGPGHTSTRTGGDGWRQ